MPPLDFKSNGGSVIGSSAGSIPVRFRHAGLAARARYTRRMPFHIHFRDTPHSDHLRGECEGWAEALRSEFPETSRVEVTVSHDGDDHEVHVHVTGKHVDVASSGKHRESVFASARDAFDKLHAQLRKHHDRKIFQHRRDKP